MERYLDPEEEQMPPKHLRFAVEYVLDENATKAAERAGYSPKSARQQGSRLLSNAAISRAIERRRSRVIEQVMEAAVITREEILRELRVLCFFNPKDFNVTAEGVKLREGVDEQAWRAVSGLKVRGGNQQGAEVLFHDKLRALELAGEPLGMWKGEAIDPKEIGSMSEAQLLGMIEGKTLDQVRKIR